MTDQEFWESCDDRGYLSTAVVEYDAKGCAMVSRQIMHELLVKAGLRLKLDATEGNL